MIGGPAHVRRGGKPARVCTPGQVVGAMPKDKAGTGLFRSPPATSQVPTGRTRHFLVTDRPLVRLTLGDEPLIALFVQVRHREPAV